MNNKHNSIPYRGIFCRGIHWLSISVLLLLAFPSSILADTFKVTLILSQDSPVYTITEDTIRSVVSGKSDRKIEVATISAKDIRLLTDKILNNVDLYVPLGQAAFKEIIKHANSSAILASLIPRDSFISIRANNANEQPRNKSITGAVFVDQPDDRLISLTRLVLPGINNAGMLISSDNTNERKEKLDGLFNKINLKHHIEVISDSSNIMHQIRFMLEDIDVLIATPDPLIFNSRNSRNILLSTYRKMVPVIGFSQSYVKAGALASVYSTPQNIGKQTGEIIIQLANQSGISSLPSYYPKYFSISTNPQVARSLNLQPINEADVFNALIDLERISND